MEEQQKKNNKKPGNLYCQDSEQNTLVTNTIPFEGIIQIILSGTVPLKGSYNPFTGSISSLVTNYGLNGFEGPGLFDSSRTSQTITKSLASLATPLC